MTNRYQQCRFLLSAHRLNQLPADTGFEVAFAGRSNSGKSSAINRICGQKSLAKTSRTPGRTQAINFFAVNENRRIVDLPGYGYARVPAKTRQLWRSILTRYIQTRNSLRALMLIMDIRHPLQDQDWSLIELAASKTLAVHLLLTKCDKLSRNESQRQLYRVKSELENQGVEATLQLFSAQDGIGIDDAQFMLDGWFEFNQENTDPQDNQNSLD